MSVELTTLVPFGVEVRVPDGTAFESIAPSDLHGWLKVHRLVLLRGVRAIDKRDLPAAARRLGPLQAWSFGSVHELEPDDEAKNYLYTRRGVPLHWDGAFTPRVPRYLVFHCVEAPPAGSGGETLFTDTTLLWRAADDATRDRWRALRFAYSTDRVVHYGGRFESRTVTQHPETGETVLRFAEPVDDLNPVHVEAIGLGPLESAAVVTELRRALHQPDVMLAHTWRAGDVVIADNHALLHGRNGFTKTAPRHIRRVNVHGPTRGRWDWLWDSLRIRRLEFLVAEIPILVIPMLLAPHVGLGPSLLAAVLFFLLFHFGDMINCVADRDLDAVYKTHLSESVYGLGVANVWAQIAVTVALALGIGAWLGPDVLDLTAFGLALGAQYSLRPFWLKGRGVLQVLTLWALIFVGPMVLVTHALGAPIGGSLWVLFGCYGAMQEGIVLVNTAEDLPEDQAMGITTTAVQLGLRGALGLATLLVVAGGLGVLCALLHGGATPWALAPLLCAWLWVGQDIARLALRVARGGDRALAILRPRAKRVPFWITATAWGTLATVALTRMG